MRPLAAVASAVLLCATAAVASAQPRSDLVQAELVPSVASVQPGQPFLVGVRLKLAPHWHVYWKNPGDSGQATQVKWELPKGWTASDLRFPVPTRFIQPGDIAGYGYEDEVVLLTEITPPKDAAGTAPLKARVSWLVCKDVCIPGKADLSMALPVSADAAPANADLLDSWQQRVPTEPNEANFTVNAGPGITATVTAPTPLKDPVFFPEEVENLSIENITTDTHDRSVSIDVTAGVLANQTVQLDRLPGVLAYTDPAGVRRGVRLELPLETLRAPSAPGK